MTKRFRACVHYVDDTYWDDGSRWTSDRYEFVTLGEAVAFRQRTLATSYKTTSRQTGKPLFMYRLDDDAVTIDQRTDGKWHRLQDGDIISLLGEVARD